MSDCPICLLALHSRAMRCIKLIFCSSTDTLFCASFNLISCVPLIQTMAQHGNANATPEDYFTDGEPAPVTIPVTNTAQQLAQQPVRLFSPVPSPGTAIATNMVAQRNLLPAVPGGHNSRGANRGAKRLSRSRSPSATPPRGRWATNSPPLGRRGTPPPGPASDPGPGSEADHSVPPTLPKARTKPTASGPTSRDWAQELTQTR